MSADEYVPDEMDARGCFLDGAAGAFVTEDWEAFLARVRRDAAREALDGYALWEQESFLDLHTKGAVMSAAACQHAQFAAAEYRDTHYPEESP